MSHPSFKIIPSQPQDREALLHFHRETRYKNDLLVYPDYAEATRRCGYYEKIWNKNFPDPAGLMSVLKAVQNEEIIGFARFGPPDPTEYDPLRMGGYLNGLGELHQIYVDDKMRSAGVGAELYRRTIAEMGRLGYRHMLVATYDINQRAKDFYIREGARLHYVYQDQLERDGESFSKPVAVLIHADLGGSD